MVTEGSGSVLNSGGSGGISGIRHFLPAFQEHYSILLGRRSGTIQNYTRTLEHFDTFLKSRGAHGGIPVIEITQDAIEAWLKDLYFHQGNKENISRATKLSAIKAFFKFLVYKRVLSESPAALIPSPRIKRHLPQKFSTKQLRDIFAGPDLSTPMGIRDLAILKTLYGSGPRVEEIRGLDIDDIHQGRTDVYLHYHETKGGDQRIVHLRRNPSQALLRWVAMREKYVEPCNPDAAKSLFISMTRNRPGRRLSVKAYNEVLKKYAALVGIKNERVFVHKMRSTFATDLYDLGFDILKISYIMGHKSVETTQRYIATSETALKKTAIPDRRWKELDRRDVDAETTRRE